MSACPSCAKDVIWPDYRRGRQGLCGECYARRNHPAGSRLRDKREPENVGGEGLRSHPARSVGHRANEAHPSPLTLVPGGRDAVNAWLQHVPGCGCDRCGYVEEHLDDDLAHTSHWKPVR